MTFSRNAQIIEPPQYLHSLEQSLRTHKYVNNIPLFRIIKYSNLILIIIEFIQVTKSVISLLRYYRWEQFSILHEEPWLKVALLLEIHAKKHNMTVNHLRQVSDVHKCCEDGLQCCNSGHTFQVIQETKNRTRSTFTYKFEKHNSCIFAYNKLLLQQFTCTWEHRVL